MKKALLAVAALSCVGTAALAGPNAGGTLIAALSVGTVYTPDNTGYCGSSTTTDCGGAVVSHTGDVPAVINVIAVFPGSPRLAGITFGIAYGSDVLIIEGGGCGDFELSDATWPASGTGTAVTWGSAATSQLVEVYWLAAANYYGTADALTMIAHPTQLGNFGDDDVPSNIDPIAGYGVFGFNQPGQVACPAGGVGACCFPDGSCTVLSEAECGSQGGVYQGDDSTCDGVVCPQPDPTGACCINFECFILTRDECATGGGTYMGDDVPCDDTICDGPTPTIESSWGTIKNNYR